ncbi:hypothetical protein BKK56_03650 [Rodentibacter genomosp. 2]|uniref:DUF2523 family protein n=1 Tax=Rodentibacter genomosp. 2 TaxID=1908266 RepID=UPI0009845754|nr:hypothetical protein BKK56_03650 [Rodentibacter genomosp. 2]
MGALISFLSKTFTGVLGWLFNVVVIKFVMFGLIFLALTEVVPLLIQVFLPEDAKNISSLLSSVPSQVAYFLSMFKLDLGIKSVVSAYVTRFLIRRIPFVG